MADRDPQILAETATPLPPERGALARIRRYALMLIVPLLLIGGASY